MKEQTYGQKHWQIWLYCHSLTELKASWYWDLESLAIYIVQKAGCQYKWICCGSLNTFSYCLSAHLFLSKVELICLSCSDMSDLIWSSKESRYLSDRMAVASIKPQKFH